MAEYRIFETRQFAKDLKEIAKAGQPQVLRRLERAVYPRLRQHPHFGPNIRKLKGYVPETWRYRIGAWRFFYQIDDADGVVVMIAASHRSSAY